MHPSLADYAYQKERLATEAHDNGIPSDHDP